MKLSPDLLSLFGIFDSNSIEIARAVSGVQPQALHAVNEAWNWVNIGILTSIVLGIGLVVMVSGGLLIYFQLNRSKARRPQLKKPGANSTTASTPRKRQSSDVISVRLTPYIPTFEPLPAATGRKSLKRLSSRK